METYSEAPDDEVAGEAKEAKYSFSGFVEIEQTRDEDV